MVFHAFWLACCRYINIFNLSLRLTFDFLRRLVPSIGKDSIIYNVQFDPNNQDDVTDSQFCPNIVSSTEVTIVLLNQIGSSWFVIDFDRTRKGQNYSKSSQNDK